MNIFDAILFKSCLARQTGNQSEAKVPLLFIGISVLHVSRELVISVIVALSIAHEASGAPTFTNVTAEVGITHVQLATSGPQVTTGGVATGDFDGDGLADLFFTRVDGPDILYRNTGNGFEDVSHAAGFVDITPTNGVTAGDIDNDGDLDLYVMGSESERHFLYVNDGMGHFTEEAISRGANVSAGVGALDRRGQGVAFGDFDGDGYLDAMTSDHSRPTGSSGSRLLRNLGAANPGHFVDVTQSAGLDVYRTPIAVTNPINSYRFQPQFSDLDRDGLLDIVIASDSRTSQLFWNNGDGTFTDGTTLAGVGTDKTGMGTALGDYDGDGDLDWFVTAIYDTTALESNPGNRLYRNNGDRTFTDVTSAAGVRNAGPGLSWGWGTVFFDYDNDADLDLIATNGFVAGYTADRTTLWSNNKDSTFTDVSESAGIIDTGQGRGLLHFDYDSDGDLDVVVANYADTPIVYRNDGGNESSWLRVIPEGVVSNSNGIGAVVTIVTDTSDPDIFQVREIGSGGSYLSQSEFAAHFGLDDLTGTVDLVEVFWPTSGLVQRYTDVSVNTTLYARERLLGDFNGDSIVDAADYTVWRDANGQTNSGFSADVIGNNGLPDGVIDHLDFLIWKANYGLTYITEGTINVKSPALPEPSCITLSLLCVLSICYYRPRRHLHIYLALLNNP